jgi:hypothetical protein
MKPYFLISLISLCVFSALTCFSFLFIIPVTLFSSLTIYLVWFDVTKPDTNRLKEIEAKLKRIEDVVASITTSKLLSR